MFSKWMRRIMNEEDHSQPGDPATYRIENQCDAWIVVAPVDPHGVTHTEGQQFVAPADFLILHTIVGKRWRIWRIHDAHAADFAPTGMVNRTVITNETFQ